MKPTIALAMHEPASASHSQFYTIEDRATRMRTSYHKARTPDMPLRGDLSNPGKMWEKVTSGSILFTNTDDSKLALKLATERIPYIRGDLLKKPKAGKTWRDGYAWATYHKIMREVYGWDRFLYEDGYRRMWNESSTLPPHIAVLCQSYSIYDPNTHVPMLNVVVPSLGDDRTRDYIYFTEHSKHLIQRTKDIVHLAYYACHLKKCANILFCFDEGKTSWLKVASEMADFTSEMYEFMQELKKKAATDRGGNGIKMYSIGPTGESVLSLDKHNAFKEEVKLGQSSHYLGREYLGALVQNGYLVVNEWNASTMAGNFIQDLSQTRDEKGKLAWLSTRTFWERNHSSMGGGYISSLLHNTFQCWPPTNPNIKVCHYSTGWDPTGNVSFDVECQPLGNSNASSHAISTGGGAGVVDQTDHTVKMQGYGFINVLPVHYDKPHQYGDFVWEVKNNKYPRRLYIFNDNALEHFETHPGANTGALRAFNRHSQNRPTRSAGVSTGWKPGIGNGYRDWTDGMDAILKYEIEEIKYVLAQGHHDTVVYSADVADKLIGCGVYCQGDPSNKQGMLKARQNITSELLKLASLRVGPVDYAIDTHVQNNALAAYQDVERRDPTYWNGRKIQGTDVNISYEVATQVEESAYSGGDRSTIDSTQERDSEWTQQQGDATQVEKSARISGDDRSNMDSLLLSMEEEKSSQDGIDGAASALPTGTPHNERLVDDGASIHQEEESSQDGTAGAASAPPTGTPHTQHAHQSLPGPLTEEDTASERLVDDGASIHQEEESSQDGTTGAGIELSEKKPHDKKQESDSAQPYKQRYADSSQRLSQIGGVHARVGDSQSGASPSIPVHAPTTGNATMYWDSMRGLRHIKIDPLLYTRNKNRAYDDYYKKSFAKQRSKSLDRSPSNITSEVARRWRNMTAAERGQEANA